MSSSWKSRERNPLWKSPWKTRERNRRRRVSLRIRGKLENEISSCRGKTTRARAHVQRMSLLRFSITKQQRTKCLELCNVAPLREAQQPRREAITHFCNISICNFSTHKSLLLWMLCIHALKGGSCKTKCHSLIKNANKNAVAFLFAKAERPCL